MSDPVRLDEEASARIHAAQRRRAQVTGYLLGALAILFFAITIAKLSLR